MHRQPQGERDISDRTEVNTPRRSDNQQPIMDPDDAFAFFDLEVDSRPVGRVVFKLFKSKAPKACQNFLELCSGSHRGNSGKRLSYNGTIIHQVNPNLMVRGGDVINFDGSGGESIYGPTFEDESYEVELTQGTLGMVNQGTKDTNSSQFFICCDKCPHLEGTNVGFGQIIKGYQIIEAISNIPNKDGVPLTRVSISNCGQLKADPKTWHYEEDDGLDQYPPYPDDLETDFGESSPEWAKEIMKVVENIKLCGNSYFEQKEYEKALSKYTKAVLYLSWVKDKREDVYDSCTALMVHCLSNMAVAHINCQNFRPAHQLCSQVLQLRPTAKAYFRRGQANFGLHDYQAALRDLKEAQKMEPLDKRINSEISLVKNAMVRSKADEIKLCANMLR